ncbi:sensor histidine kinase [Niabella drilacis]|uniref:Histidine kinase n=1 Tax=Niabella drilacis (strain DSM 25811 / CCM 8410 / CCUG 62505 / LMG 26954 / E90) TaxID=1285928 RepID=A0A1G6N0U2_NIADE|nr:histidine kinase [Niabella drilacis]SDC61452.1 Histidine kinase [Niabella drilacis]
MNKKWIIPVYAGAVILLMTVSEIIYTLRTGTPFRISELLRPITLSQVIYMTLTLLLTRYMLYAFFLTKKYLQLLLAVVLVFTVFVFLRYLLEEVVFPRYLNFRNYPKGTTLGFYTLDNLHYGLSYIVLGIVFFFLEYRFDVQKKEAALLQRSKEAELAFLRSQISPHFLFNSLNSIYTLSYKQSSKTSGAILQLSELVRFMLYEQKPLIPVETEWNYLMNYIGLQEMRYPHAVGRDIRLEGDTGAAQIPPFLLIPLVENAFKHGDFSDARYPLSIALQMVGNRLIFKVENKKGCFQKDQEGGIGIENIQRRLELLYPRRHELTIAESDATYGVTLVLEL